MATPFRLKKSTAFKNKLTIDEAKVIERMYSKLSKEVGTKAALINPNKNYSSGIEKAYLNNLQKQIGTELKKIGKNVSLNIENSMKLVSSAVCNDNLATLKQVGFPTEGAFSHIPTKVVAKIAEGKIYSGKWSLSSAIWSDVKNKQKDINVIVAQGTALNKSAFEIAKDLEKYVDPKAKKDWEWSKVYPNTSKKVDYNAQRLSRTMTAHAYQQSVIETATHNPFIKGVKWFSLCGSRTCDLCKDRNGQVFKADEVPMDHPNGLCSMIPYVEDSMEDVADRIGNWMSGEEDKELDIYAEKINAKYQGGGTLKSVKGQQTKNKTNDKTIMEKTKAAANNSANKTMTFKKFDKSTFTYSDVDMTMGEILQQPLNEQLKFVKGNGALNNKDLLYIMDDESKLKEVTTKAINELFNKKDKVDDVVEVIKDTKNIKERYMKGLQANSAKKKIHADYYDYPEEEFNGFKSWFKKLSKAEEDGINVYTGGTYTRINMQLRVKPDLEEPAYIDSLVKEIKKGLNKSEISKTTFVRRGSDEISLAGISGLKESELRENYKSLIGTIAEDKGFMSTSPLPNGGFSAKGVEYIIELPKGTKGQFIAPISQFKSEQETLLQAGTRFLIEDIEYNPNDYRKTFTVYMKAIVDK